MPPEPTSLLTDQRLSDSCFNCGYNPLNGNDFCPQCGQRKQAQRLTIGELFIEAANALFGYDSQLWRTLRYIWVPGKLPSMYRSGQRKALLHPVRLFFFSFVILALVSQFTMNSLFSDSPEKDGFINIHQNEADTARTVLLGEESIPNILGGIDSLRFRDSIGLFYKKPEGDISAFAVSKQWVEEMTHNQLLDTLNIQGFFHRMAVTQQLKFIESQKSFSQFLTRALVWMFLLLQPILAFLLLLAMWRKTYYSDHLIWSVYTHAAFFIFLIIYLLLDKCISTFWSFEVTELLILIFAIIMIYYTSISVKRYYALKWWRWILAMIYLYLVYIVCFILMFLLNLIVSFFLF